MSEKDYINKEFGANVTMPESIKHEHECSAKEPQLTRCEFQFEQQGNCIDGGDEILVVEVKTDSVSLDKDSLFFVLKTEQWSIDSVDELKKLLNGISELIENI
jgi:hypothetical protein